MSRTFNVAVVGATGLVGEAIIELLAARDFPVAELYPLVSERSAGSRVAFKGRSRVAGNLADFDFSQVELAFFAVPPAVAAESVPRATDAGALVIDASAAFRQQDDVPLVVAGVNPEALAGWRDSNRVAMPDAATAQLLLALKPLDDAVGLERVSVNTLQAVSGSGRAGMEALAAQAAELLNGREVTPRVYPGQIAFNIVAREDGLLDDGASLAEADLAAAVRKVLGAADIRIQATHLRVPVFFGHSQVIQVETRAPMSADEARILLEQAPGVTVIDGEGAGAVASAVQSAGSPDRLYLSRIRDDLSHPQGLAFWAVADNVRFGAALNGVQIAEILIKDYL